MSDYSRRDVMRGGLSAAVIAALGGQLLTSEKADAATGLPVRHAGARRPQTRVRFPGDPGVGNAFYGASVAGGDPTALESSVGRTLGTYRSYFSPGDSAATLAARAQRDINAGRYPIISTHINGTWRENANGQYDQWFKDRLVALNAVGPMSFCVDHEPENDTGKGGAADFKAMYLHFKPIVDAYAPNLMLTPIIMSGKYNPNGTPNPDKRLKFEDWLDKDGCHAWGADGYNHFSPASGTKWRTVPETFQPIFDGLDALDSTKPIIWAEYGVRADPTDPGKARKWMWEAYELCLRNSVSVMSFFSSSVNVNDGGAPWTLDGERLHAFTSILQHTP